MLKARYACFGDTKDWAEFRNCVSDDFQCRVEGAPRASADAPADYAVSGADAFVANAQKIISAIQAIHQLSLPEITIISDTTATGIWALHDYLLAPRCIFRGWAYYHDEYVNIAGHWKIRKSAVTRVRVEETWL